MFLRLRESKRKTDRRVLGMGVVSFGVHTALIVASGYAIRSSGHNSTSVVADTTVVFLESPQLVPQELPAQLAIPLKGFQTLAALPVIPTSIPPVDLQQHFDPRDYSGSGVEGHVLLQAIVDTAGRLEPNSVRILKSSSPGFDLPTRAWALAARFRPARLQGRAVRVLVNLPFDFSMSAPGG